MTAKRAPASAAPPRLFEDEGGIEDTEMQALLAEFGPPAAKPRAAVDGKKGRTSRAASKAPAVDSPAAAPAPQIVERVAKDRRSATKL